uniref:Zona pellucida sperm-binding protein 3 n=1 Tax=Amphiprion ocellaris TaxID=80972 RepID=A0AAQ5ZXU8_AMPOC
LMKCPAVCLVALALLGNFCDAQWASGVYMPQKPVYSKPQEPKPYEPPQQKQTFEQPLTWTYPQPPTPAPKPDVPFELRYPVPAATVAVECRESQAHVEVKRDFFGIGQLINPADLKLGNCGPVAEDTVAKVLVYESALQDCESELVTTEDSLVYTFTLNYNPQPVGGSPVVRTSKAAVIVECHYQRKHNVSSLPLDPIWVPFSAAKMAEEFLYFTMSLMTDDWQYERPSYQYFLGDLIYIDVKVHQYFHVPLRVYVEHCVATLSPDQTSSPRYVFIDNNGCFVDARITGSSSRYVARPEENKLCFQLEAFRFQGADSGMLYITCRLKATSTAYSVDQTHRACSYIDGWREISRADSVCASCEQLQSVGSVTSSWGTTGGANPPATLSRKIRDVSETQTETFEWVGDVRMGPISIADKPVA